MEGNCLESKVATFDLDHPTKKLNCLKMKVATFDIDHPTKKLKGGGGSMESGFKTSHCVKTLVT